MGDPARPGPQFLARSAGEGEGGWFPAPQPLIVGFGAPALAAAVLRIFGVRTCCRLADTASLCRRSFEGVV